MRVTTPPLSVDSPQTEEDFRTNITDLVGQRNQKRGELFLLEQQLRDQKQQLQILRTQQPPGPLPPVRGVS